nr:SDR family NAD(P)-dependent oxidoreductase [uncultured Albidiferax sp.]
MSVPATAQAPEKGLFDLAGRVVLVTGATGGLGLAITHAMAAQGATLVVSDHNRAACEALAAALRHSGAQARAVTADLLDPAQTQALVSCALDCFGRLDVLVCNAGVQGPAGPMADTTDEDWERVMRINLRSAMDLTRHAASHMAKHGGGSVILMASIAGLRGNKAIGLYGLSKAALAQLARNLAVEWGPQGVRVNTIAPGLIRTPLSVGLMDNAAFMARRLAATPLRRVGEPHEVAGVAVMLASAAGGFITGQNIVVDGGTLISDGN